MTSLIGLGNFPHIQYQANFWSNSSNTLGYYPELYNVTIHYTSTAQAGNSCSCPHSVIQCSDNCILSNCDEGGNSVTIVGTSGSVTFTGRLTHYSRIATHGCSVVCRVATGCTG